ncbi:YraN family protein [Kocuria oceani]|uniref:YraN family protein n=1 Tax=Kocuria oceani TaxID=988827 RepID=UPI00403663A0
MSGGLGAHGEQLAAAHLTELGYRVLDRNWRAVPARDGLRGEVDVVAEQGEWVVAVEVKTRSSVRYGHPFESITRARRCVCTVWRRPGRGPTTATPR